MRSIAVSQAWFLGVEKLKSEAFFGTFLFSIGLTCNGSAEPEFTGLTLGVQGCYKTRISLWILNNNSKPS